MLREEFLHGVTAGINYISDLIEKPGCRGRIADGDGRRTRLTLCRSDAEASVHSFPFLVIALQRDISIVFLKPGMQDKGRRRNSA